MRRFIGTGSRRAATGTIRWPPTLNSFGVTTSCGLLQQVRHETRMRCPNSRVVRIKRGDMPWPHSLIIARIRPITSPSFTVTSHEGPNFESAEYGLGGDPAPGGPRCRRHNLPGRWSTRHGRVISGGRRPRIARPFRSVPVLHRRLDRAGVSPASLTIASNSASSHSSSSQTSAQKSASTASEPSAEPVFSRPSIATHPLTLTQESLLMYVRWCRFGISPDITGRQEGRGRFHGQ